MKIDKYPRFCDSCGNPYQVDESSESYMNPPDDYRQGYQHYCLACWLGVDHPNQPELFASHKPPRPVVMKGIRSYDLKDQIKMGHRKEELRGELNDRVKSIPSIYLWLCCEGWMKFGPFEWLRFDDERQAILDPDGEEVAKKTDGYWRMPDGQGKGMQFSNPTITNSPIHPHRNCGSHPGRRRGIQQ